MSNKISPNNYLIFTSFLLFLLPFHTFAMKRCSTAFLAQRVSLAHNHNAYKIRTHPMLIAASQKSPSLAGLHKRKQKKFNTHNRFVNPLIAGVALTTGMGLGILDHKKVYAHEEELASVYENNKVLDEIRFAALNKDRFDFFKEKLKNNPSLKEQYKELIEKNLSDLIHIRDLIDCLESLYEKEELAALFVRNWNQFESLAKPKGFDDVRHKIVSIICSRYISIEEVFNNKDLTTWLKLTDYDELRYHFLTLIAEQLGSLSSNQSQGFYTNIDGFIYRICQSSPQLFTQLALLNLPLMGNLLFCSIITFNIINPFLRQMYPAEAQKLSHALVEHSAVLEKTEYGPLLVHRAIKANALLKDRWFELMKENIQDASLSSLIVMTRYKPCDQEIKKSITAQDQQSLEDRISNMVKVHAYHTSCPHECIDNKIKKDTTQSSVHMEQLSQQLVKQYFEIAMRDRVFFHWLNDRDPKQIGRTFHLFDHTIETLINKVFAKERELSNDYYTFIHGQRSEYLLWEQLHTFLQQVTQKKQMQSDYLALHIKDVPEHPQLKLQKKLRNRLLKHGRNNFQDRQHLLFVNWAYFGNSTNLASSSAYYIANNVNVGSVAIKPYDIFELNNVKHLYLKYEERLEALAVEFKELTQYGTCMLIAIPKATVNKHIYLAVPGGAKGKLEIEGIGKTDDMRIIMETLINEPKKIKDSDEIEFCIPMTYDKKGALNPESGIKIFAFNAADQEKLDAYYAKQKALFEEIRKDIEKSSC